MSSKNKSNTHKRFKYFKDQIDFEAPFHFLHKLPPVPIKAKLINSSVSLEKIIKYEPICTDINKEKFLFSDICGGINVDLINPDVYYQKNKDSNLSQPDLEL